MTRIKTKYTNQKLKRMLYKYLKDTDRGIYIFRLKNLDNNYCFNIIIEYGLDYKKDSDELTEYIDIYQGRRDGEYTGNYEVITYKHIESITAF